MNKIILIGRLTKNPEIRFAQNETTVAQFTLAVDRNFAKQGEEVQTDFINIAAWNRFADLAQNHLVKGSKVAIMGRLQVRKYQDKDGNNRYATEVIVDEMDFLDKKKQYEDLEDNPISILTSDKPVNKNESEIVEETKNEKESEFPDVMGGDEDDLPF